MRLFSTILLFFIAQFASAQNQETADADSLKLRLHNLYTEFIDQEIRENYDSAYSLICQCYKLDSTQAEIIYQHAIYEHMNMQKDSTENILPAVLSEFERAYAKDRTNKKYAKTLFSLYANEGDTLKICSVLEDLSALDKSNDQYVSMLIGVYETMGEYEKELAAIDRLEQLVGRSFQTEQARISAIWKQKGEKKAIKYWKTLVKQNPKEPAYQEYMGKMILREGKPYSAAVYLRKALKLDPTNDEVRYLLTKCYEWHGKKDKARNMKLEAINNPRTSSDLKVQLLRDMLEEYEAAPNGTQKMVALFKQALSTPQENPDMTMLYSGYLQSQKCTTDSISRAMSELLQTEPTNVTAHNVLLAFFSERDSLDGVITTCQHAIDNGIEMLEFHFYLGIAHYQKKDWEKATQVLLTAVANKQFIRNTKLYAQCYSALGDLYHKQDSLQKSYDAYEQCITWNPDDDEALNNYAYYLSIEGGDLHKAERMSKKSIESQPNRGTYLDTYAWILFKLGRYEEALVYINKAVSNGGGGSVVYEHAGDIYALNGDIDAAMAYWELAKGQDDVSDKLEQKIAEKRYIP